MPTRLPQPRRLFATLIAACCFVSPFLLTDTAQASITGTPVGDHNFPAWNPNSTNELNYLSQTPSRVGQPAPHVLLNSVAPGEVTLDFFAGGYTGQSRFEVRIDGVSVGTNAHPIVIGDTIHPGPNVHANNITYPSFVQQTFTASQYVDVRLALGGERVYDFNWTRFDVGVVPEPATMVIWSGLAVMAGVVTMRRRLGGRRGVSNARKR